MNEAPQQLNDWPRAGELWTVKPETLDRFLDSAHKIRTILRRGELILIVSVEPVEDSDNVRMIHYLYNEHIGDCRYTLDAWHHFYEKVDLDDQ